MKVIGLAGWSGAGKTTLLTRLIPHFIAEGLRVSVIKHAHHEFDVDVPGKDSWVHRQSGAAEVLVSSTRRWAWPPSYPAYQSLRPLRESG